MAPEPVPTASADADDRLQPSLLLLSLPHSGSSTSRRLVEPLERSFQGPGAKTEVLELYGDVSNGKAVTLASASSSPRSHLAIASSIVSAVFDASAYCYPQTIQTAGEPPDALADRFEEFSTGFARFTEAITRLHASTSTADREGLPVGSAHGR
ncbi:hypothetical protein ABZ922_43220 [Streptomyces shenzhenensis]|uniref:hypothetical protein n=1 Tax=Streptomyces shenzhenensis TaxID=943815 RepID=UPI003400FC3E